MSTVDQAELQEQKQNEAANEGKATKRNKAFDLAEARMFTERNAQVDFKIMLALYEHRSLTPSQVKRVWFPKAHENSIRNRMKALADRKILTLNLKAGLKTRPIHLYSLSAFGLRIVTENILQVMEYVPQLDERKEHYTIDDLKVRHQHNHHYDLQEWVTNVLSKRAGLLHCEWKRFPFVEDKDEAIQVKPDWLIVEMDEATIESILEDQANNPLLYPYFYRKEVFTDTTYKPVVCVECDRGTMSKLELVEKWEGYRKLPTDYKPEAIVAFHKPESNGEIRHRSIRDTLSYSFELEVGRNEIQLFEGSHELTRDIVSLYLERDKNLLQGEEMTNVKELQSMIAEYGKTLETGEASLLDIEKTTQHFKLPITPDGILAKQVGEVATLQFIFYCLPGWVNPFIKIQSIQKWIKEGHLSKFTDIRFILMYPDQSFLQDIRLIDKTIFYVSYQEIKENLSWGKAHQEVRKNRKVNWQQVTL
jgi:Replication-relaxation